MVEQRPELTQLLDQWLGIGVVHSSFGTRSGGQVHATRVSRQLELEPPRILRHVAKPWALTAATESGHAVLHVGEEAFTWVFAVVADINATVELFHDGFAGGRDDCLPELFFVHQRSFETSGLQFDQSVTAGQAARVGGENSRTGCLHGFSSNDASCFNG